MFFNSLFINKCNASGTWLIRYSLRPFARSSNFSLIFAISSTFASHIEWLVSFSTALNTVILEITVVEIRKPENGAREVLDFLRQLILTLSKSMIGSRILQPHTKLFSNNPFFLREGIDHVWIEPKVLFKDVRFVVILTGNTPRDYHNLGGLGFHDTWNDTSVVGIYVSVFYSYSCFLCMPFPHILRLTVFVPHLWFSFSLFEYSWQLSRVLKVTLRKSQFFVVLCCLSLQITCFSPYRKIWLFAGQDLFFSRGTHPAPLGKFYI